MRQYPFSLFARQLKKIRFVAVIAFFSVVFLVIVMYYLLKHRGRYLTCGKSSDHKEPFSSNGQVDVKMFYVDWCGHCKSTKPGFKEFMDKYNGTQAGEKQVKIEMINCEENETTKNLASQYGVKGYPTIIAEVDGKKIVYESSDRTSGGFSRWLEKIDSI